MKENTDKGIQVSVIIPVYNRPHLAQEAVNSVLSQSKRPYEIMVIDDGSEEVSPYLADSKDITYIRTEHSGYPGKTRNIGVFHASGNWIAFLDSDDLWQPEKLEEQTAYILENPEYRICHTRELWLREGKEVSQKGQKHKRQGDVFSDALWKCIIGPSTVMLEKALYEEYRGFREDLEVAEDYELWLRICNTEQIGYIDKKLIIKRAGDWDQLSEKHGQIEIFRINALKELVDKKAFTPPRLEEASRVLAKKLRIYATGAEKRGRLEEAESYRALALQYASY
ncbi:MAG: glycosyltransferase family A protein [Spirochaetia bacterium]